MRSLSCHRILHAGVACIAAVGAAQVGKAQITKSAVARSVSTKTAEIPAISQLIARSFSDVTLEDALATVARDAGYVLVYNKRDVDLSKRVTIKLQQVTLDAALNELLKGTGYRGMIAGKSRTMVITRSDRAEQQAESHLLIGRVTDSATRKALVGVTVSVVGLKRSTTTGKDGRYRLPDIPDGTYTVTVRFLGYNTKSQTVKIVGDNVELDFHIVQSTTTLSEVVTTVTGAQRKLEMGNAIATLNVDSIMKVAPVTTLTDLLENRVPGLVVQRSSGQPGDPSRIRLRGASSINNSNDPIVVVDGVRVAAAATAFGAKSGVKSTNILKDAVDAGAGQYLAVSAFDQIDPNSIESVTIFKGPSAAAMYGSDAANGVIVITTKRGRPGQARWSASLNQGITYTPGTFATGHFRFGSLLGIIPFQCPFDGNLATGALCSVDSVVAFQALNDPYYTVLGHGLTRGQSLTVSGGSQALLYALTGSGSQEHGLLKMSRFLTERYQNAHGSMPKWMAHPDNYTTWSGSGKLTAEVNSVTQVALTSALFTSNQRKTMLGNEAINTFSKMYRTDTLKTMNDKFYERALRNSIKTTNAISLNWRVVPWLPIAATAGIDAQSFKDESYLPRGMSRSNIHSDTLGHYGISRTSIQTRSLSAVSQIPLLDNRITTSIGLTLNHQANEVMSAEVNQVAVGVPTPSDGFTNTRQQSSGITTTGWFIEPRLNLGSRLYINPGFRIDNNGSQGERAGLFNLPKMDLSWIASEESFFPWKSVIDLFRVGMAFGTAGVQPGVSDRLRLFATDTTIQSTQPDSLYYLNTSISTLGNTRLRPERSTEYEGSLTAELWRGRLGIDFIGYRKTRYDAIVSVPTAPSLALSSGRIGSYSANIGVIRNTGTEVTLRIVPLESSQWGWQTRISWAQNQNVIARLNVNDQPIQLTQPLSLRSGSVRRVVAGYPLWGVWARPIIGVYDADGNGMITTNEVALDDSTVYLGQPEPKGTMSMTNDWSFFRGRFNVYTSMSYQYGMTQTSEMMRDLASPFNSLANTPNATLWQQAIAISSSTTAYGITQDVNTFRFETISINTRLGDRIAHMFRARTISVALQGSNLWMKSNYIGKDPNVNSVLMGSGVTADIGMLPPPRKWSLRISVGN